MLRHLHIENFKSLTDTDVELGPLTVFIGANGAGKSSLFRAIDFLRQLVTEGSINDALADANATFSDIVSLRSTEKAITLQARIIAHALDNLERVDAQYEIIVRKRKFCYIDWESVDPYDRRGTLLDESQIDDMPYLLRRFGKHITVASDRNTRPMRLEGVTGTHSRLHDILIRHHSAERTPRPFPQLTAIARALVNFVHFEVWAPEALRQPANPFHDTLGADGSNLPAALWHLRKRSRADYDHLLQDMRAAYPWLEDIEFKSYADGMLGLSFREKTSLTARRGKQHKVPRYNPNQVSDGFLRMLALTSLKYLGGYISTLAYEEPENGLHPRMIEMASQQIREIAARNIQVLISTHSPAFLSAIFADSSAEQIVSELRLVTRDGSGNTTVSPPSLDIVRTALEDGLLPGDLWAILLDEKQLH